jgi:CheY-like chemotaxis protein
MNAATSFSPSGLSVRKLVLLVEDDQDSALLQSKIIERAGGRVHVENTVSGALEFLERNSPDLVLTDLNFPHQSLQGFDFLLQRSGGAVAGGPAVIVVSGRSDSDSLEDALRLGASGFISKPFLPKNYERTISKAMTDRDVLVGMQPIPQPPAAANELAGLVTLDRAQGKMFDRALTTFEGYLLASLAASLLFSAYAGVIQAAVQSGGLFFSF